MTLLDLVGEPLLVHGLKNRREREEHVAELLRASGSGPSTCGGSPTPSAAASASASALQERAPGRVLIKALPPIA
jgi:hypothetical protein